MATETRERRPHSPCAGLGPASPGIVSPCTALENDEAGPSSLGFLPLDPLLGDKDTSCPEGFPSMVGEMAPHQRTIKLNRNLEEGTRTRTKGQGGVASRKASWRRKP